MTLKSSYFTDAERIRLSFEPFAPGDPPIGYMDVSRTQLSIARYSGGITVRLTNSWADKNGTHSKKHDKQTFDAVAVYCPQTARVYYIRVGEFDGNVDAFTLRLEPSKNNQTARVRLAHDFLGAARLFP